MDCEALLLERDLTMHVGSQTLPDVGADDALIKVEWAGLCGSDLHVMRTGAWVQYWPATLGHEVFGVVEHAPAGADLPHGTGVVLDSRIVCGECANCLAGNSQRCQRLAFLGEARPGGFATHCVVPTKMLTRVPEGVEGSTAVLAEPLAVAAHAVGQLVGAPSRVALLGHGPIGALIHAELRRRFPDAHIEVAEPAPLRAALARAGGATCVASAADLAAGQFDAVFDAAGYRGSLAHAIELSAIGAQLVVVAISSHEVAVRPMEIAEKQLRIVGVNAFDSELALAVELLATEAWRYEPVVSDAVALAEMPERVRRQLESPDAVKLLVRP